VRELSEVVRAWEVCENREAERTSWEVPVILILSMREWGEENGARTCEGGGEERRSSVASSSSSRRAVMRRLVIGRPSTVRGRNRGFG
jgi:hypothetical protein